MLDWDDINNIHFYALFQQVTFIRQVVKRYRLAITLDFEFSQLKEKNSRLRFGGKLKSDDFVLVL